MGKQKSNSDRCLNFREQAIALKSQDQGGWPTFTFCVKVGRRRRRRQMDNPYAGLREFPPLQKP